MGLRNQTSAHTPLSVEIGAEMGDGERRMPRCSKSENDCEQEVSISETDYLA